MKRNDRFNWLIRSLAMAAIIFAVTGCSDDTPSPNPDPIPPSFLEASEFLMCGTEAVSGEFVLGEEFPASDAVEKVYVGNTVLPCDDWNEFLISGMIGQLTVEEYFAVNGYKVIDAEKWCSQLGYDGLEFSDNIEYNLDWGVITLTVERPEDTVTIGYSLSENFSVYSRVVGIYLLSEGRWYQVLLVQNV